MRSDNLKNHIKIHEKMVHQSKGVHSLQSTSTQTCSPFLDITMTPTSTEKSNKDFTMSHSQVPIQNEMKREELIVTGNGVESDEDLFEKFTHMEMEDLSNIFDECSDVVDDENRSNLEDLEKLCDDFGQYVGGEMILPKIEAKLGQLEQSMIPRTELISLKIIINDIEKKRKVFKEMVNAMKSDDIQSRWKWLAREGSITSEDYDKLTQLVEPNLVDIISVLVNRKIEFE